MRLTQAFLEFLVTEEDPIHVEGLTHPLQYFAGVVLHTVGQPCTGLTGQLTQRVDHVRIDFRNDSKERIVVVEIFFFAFFLFFLFDHLAYMVQDGLTGFHRSRSTPIATNHRVTFHTGDVAHRSAFRDVDANHGTFALAFQMTGSATKERSEFRLITHASTPLLLKGLYQMV